MASGKSSVGKRVAELAGRPFIDLDSRIEARFGASVTRIFAEQGEPAFRRAEAEELRGLLGASDPAPVIALGGGCLMSRELRLEAIDRAVVVSLLVTPEEVARRVGQDTSRPNLAGDPLQRALQGVACQVGA